MRPKKYVVHLEEAERQELQAMLRRGQHPSRVLTRARILLLSDQGYSDKDIAAVLGVTTATVANVRQRYVEGRLERALDDRPRPGRAPKLDSHQEAYLVALACSPPPEGRRVWTLRLLADRLVQLGVVEAISHVTVGAYLKENELKPWIYREWCIPAIDEEFVARMEDILDLYEKPPEPGEVVVCVDERPYPLVADVRPPEPPRPGQPARQDYTYERRGVCNLYVAVCPDQAWREVVVTERRTKGDWGRFLVRLADEAFPEARRIHLVCDNLSGHTLGALYLVCPPEEARRRAQRFCLHYTPKHASWLNMAELEISALERQCLDRRIGDIETLRQEVAAWVRARNEAKTTVHWRFTSRDARRRLGRSYPKISS